MSLDAELYAFVSRLFPSWGAETPVRTEGLGVFSAACWLAGQQAMAARNILVPDAVHGALVQGAQRVNHTQQGGTAFLLHVRQQMADDARFAGVLSGLAQAYARKHQTGRHQRPSRGSGDGTPAAAPPPAAPPPQPPAQSDNSTVEISGYEVFELIGKGNMGRVFKARQKSLERVVALKVLDGSLAEDDPTYVERFKSEAKAVARLQHANIVGVIDQGTDEHTHIQFIAFELVDGRSAEQLMEEKKKLEEPEALALCLGICEALSCAEDHGIVHRDVKPDNILISSDGTPKLVDLGLAKRKYELEREKGLTQTGMVVGTPHYMAPEQALGIEEVDTRADLYSLGVCLFFFVTGDYPFKAATPLGIITQHVNHDVPDPRSINPVVSPHVATLLAGLCAREVKDRYPSARAAIIDFERVLAGQPPLGPVRAGALKKQSQTGGIRVGASSARWSAVSAAGSGGGAPVELTPPPDLEDEGALAIWRYEKAGHHQHLGEAELFFQNLKTSRDFKLAGRGQAGLAKTRLLRGDGKTAAELARAALESDPGSRLAVEVLDALERSQEKSTAFAAEMARLTSLISATRFGEAREVGGQIRREYPSEPLPHLALAVADHTQGDLAGFQEALQLAWALYPSKSYPLQPLGNGLDARCAELLIDHGWSALKCGEEERMLLTVENIDDRGNLVAGALRMGVGVAAVGLAGARPDRAEVRNLLFLLARGHAGLQHFGGAQDLLRRVSRLDPSPEDAKRIEDEMRRIAGFQGVQKPGIRPKRGFFHCPVAKDLISTLKRRQKDLAARRVKNHAELTSIGARVAEFIEEERIKEEVRAAAIALSADDPYEGLESLEAEQRDLEEEQRQLAEEQDEPEEPKSGFLARLKGAAGKAGRAAKQGQLKIRETHLRTRHGGEVKALAGRVVRQFGGFPFHHPELGALTKRARQLIVSSEYYEAEENHTKDALSWVGR